MATEDYIISRKRKKYRFALFAECSNCYEVANWGLVKLRSHLTLEIGAGTGLFSVELAKRHPDRQFVAIDVKADRLQKGARLALELGLENVIFLRAHVDHLPELFANSSVEQIWITFPDPYPKKRAAKHRLTNAKFLRHYREMLITNGRLCLKTDNHSLFGWSLEQLVSLKWHIQELSYDLQVSDLANDYLVKTTFEQRFTEDGLPTYFVCAN
ncbi:MAG: tRNA (guanosine(46)-N7)-methyltransferase TrmB [Microcoleus sp.]